MIELASCSCLSLFIISLLHHLHSNYSASCAFNYRGSSIADLTSAVKTWYHNFCNVPRNKISVWNEIPRFWSWHGAALAQISIVVSSSILWFILAIGFRSRWVIVIVIQSIQVSHLESVRVTPQAPKSMIRGKGTIDHHSFLWSLFRARLIPNTVLNSWVAVSQEFCECDETNPFGRLIRSDLHRYLARFGTRDRWRIISQSVPPGFAVGSKALEPFVGWNFSVLAISHGPKDALFTIAKDVNH